MVVIVIVVVVVIVVIVIIVVVVVIVIVVVVVVAIHCALSNGRSSRQTRFTTILTRKVPAQRPLDTPREGTLWRRCLQRNGAESLAPRECTLWWESNQGSLGH